MHTTLAQHVQRKEKKKSIQANVVLATTLEVISYIGSQHTICYDRSKLSVATEPGRSWYAHPEMHNICQRLQHRVRVNLITFRLFLSNIINYSMRQFFRRSAIVEFCVYSSNQRLQIAPKGTQLNEQTRYTNVIRKIPIWAIYTPPR
jgi:hypothetical protein